MPYQLPSLAYDYAALEPVISAEIMKLHHLKHHQAYVNNLNTALDKYKTALEKQDLEAQIRLQSAITFNGGGHLNHSLFWGSLGPVAKCAGKGPSGLLAQAIERDFGSFAGFQEQFNVLATAVQGSGWAWLGMHSSTKVLQIATTSNHELLSGLIPLFIVDVWEHAYYLQYKNLRGDFVRAIWQVLDWNNIEKRFLS